MANYTTHYLGTGGLVVSNSPVETDRAAREKEEVRRLMELAKASDFLEYKKQEIIKNMPRPLKQGGTVSLLTMNSLAKNTIAAYAQGMITALQKLQAKEINLSGTNAGSNKKYSTDGDVQAAASQDPYILADVTEFLQALSRMEKTFNNAASKGWINKTAWEGIKGRFFVTPGRGTQGPQQSLYLAMHRLLNGDFSAANSDMASVFNAIRGDFGNHLGKMMEDLVRYMVQVPDVQNQIKKQVANGIINSVKGRKSLGSGGAQAGTIRATLVGASYQPQPSRQKLPTTGNRLRDTELTVTTGPNGGKITWGVSVKQYNFHAGRNTLGEIKIAELSLQNFADVFARIRRSSNEQRATSRGNNALYAYRLLADNSGKNSPVLLYLLSHRVAEVTFGSNIGTMTGNDTAELMVINGRLKNTADVLEMGTLNVSTEKFPKELKGEWWQPGDAINRVNEIHKAKLVTQLEFGRTQAIQNFG